MANRFSNDTNGGESADRGRRLSRAFGGRKASSHGPREQGRYAAEYYTTLKTTYIAP
jgi:acyl-CoA reductase-like NAD-dependent aldehyde dehydrogenase